MRPYTKQGSIFCWKHKHIFLQSPSLFHVIFFYPLLLFAKSIIVYEAWSIIKPKQGFAEKLAERLLKSLKKVKKVDRELRNNTVFQSNRESDIYVEAIMERVRHMASYQIIREIVGHEMVDRIYARLLLPDVIKDSQFYRVADALKKDTLTLIPTSGNPSRRQFSIILNMFVWPGVFAFHLIKHLGKRFLDIDKPIIIPIGWGFPDKNGLLSSGGKIKRAWTSASILGEPLTKDNVAFYYGARSFNEEQKKEHRAWLKRYCYFDPKDFAMNKKHIREVLKLIANLFKLSIKNPKLLTEPFKIVRISGLIIYYFLEEMLFNHNVRYKRQVEWCEYLPQSIMRTIVANRFGRTTVGVHHSANDTTYVFPEIRYIFLNRLCVWNKVIEKAYAPFWNEFECVPIGNHRVDYVIKALEQVDILRAFVKKRWDITGRMLFVPLSNHPKKNIYQIPERFPELYKGLLRCLHEIPDLFIILRARTPNSWEDFLSEPLIKMLMMNKRVLTDYTELSTQEWIAVSDITLGLTASSAIIEAGVCGKHCLSFDTMGSGELVFGKYGIVVNTAEGLVNIIKRILLGEFKWNQGEFARDLTYFADGKNLERIQHTVTREI